MMPIAAAAPHRGYAAIYRRVLFALLLMALTPLVALGLFCMDRVGKVYDEKISAGLEAVASSKRRALDTFMVERVAQVRNLAFTHPYADLSDPARLSQIFSVMQSHSRSFADLGLIGMDGRHVAYVGPFDLRDAQYAEAPWFTEVVRKGVYVSDVFMGYRHVPHFIIAVLRHEGGRSFIVRATIDMDAISALLRREYSGPRSDAFLVNLQGVLQTDSRLNGKIMDAFDLPERLARHDMVTLSRTGPDGVEVLAAVQRLESMPWVLVVLDDAREGLKPLEQLRGLILLFMLLGGLLTCLGAVLCTRRLVAYLEASDQKQARMDAAMLQSSKMAALGKMAAGVAHEVNNPLMLIQENAGWIRDLMEDEAPESMRNYAEILESTGKIEQHVQRAKGITQRMLGFGRRMNPGRTEILLNSLADQALEMLKSEAANRNITIIRRYDPRLPVILSDPAQLEQVFINLVDNAIDAMGKDGSITLTTRPQDGGGVQAVIEDTGPGMGQETLRQIFDPFFTTKKVGEGTGLGLAICFTILEKLGGRIDVRSELGKGTAFTITLPAEPPQAAPDEGAPS